MKSRLSATHLLGHIMLFVFIALFLLTMTRAAYVVWQFNAAMADQSIINIFVQGLRFDLALICIIVLPVLVFGCLLGMLKITKGLGRFLVVLFLMLGMFFIVLSELITPYFLVEEGMRPDLPVLSAIKDPVELLASLWSSHMIPAIIGVLLATLIIIAYIARLEISRLMRYPLGVLSTIPLLVVGVLLCALGIYSHYNPLANPPLSPEAAKVSSDPVINEITLNTGYKMLHGIVGPMLPAMPAIPADAN